MSNTPRTSNPQDSGKKSEKSEGGAAERQPRPMEVLRHARAQFTELTGLAPESVSSLERTEDGWALQIDAVELARVPDTMSLLATYEVELTDDGEVIGYRRVRRYERGRADPRR
ncbi:gas vesicle protein [Streptomyces yaanensis]|uniref:Gas vesicle protein n=1 Tax=Streptomyces yaanensis TaxID=1142239 RepID=A0ABV7SDD4_9ACTN|nr:gas vesicle protein [Streptomyces sp. CGMCC 4.7035]WNB98886.1 gas vesicle protein [Streptomyces sp. CGMCC 4.7035]